MDETKVVLYMRRCKTLQHAAVAEDKWEGFYTMLETAKDKADLLVVAFPEVLGDTYEELVANLSAMASHGLRLAIVPPEDYGFTVMKRIQRDDGGCAR